MHASVSALADGEVKEAADRDVALEMNSAAENPAMWT